MTYLELSAWFVGAAVVAAIVLSVVSGRHRAHLGAVAVTVVVLFIPVSYTHLTLPTKA